MTAKKKPGLPLGIETDRKPGLSVSGIAGPDDPKLKMDSPGHRQTP